MKTNTTQVACRVPKATADALHKLANEQDRSMSWLMNRAIEMLIASQKK